MADDFGGLKGWAQVVPQSGMSGNLYALARLNQQKQISDRDFAQRQDLQNQKTYQDAVLGLEMAKNIDPLYQEVTSNSFKSGVSAMQQIHRAGGAGMSEALFGVKAGVDRVMSDAEVATAAGKAITDQIAKNPTWYNEAIVGGAIEAIKKDAIIKDENGNGVGVDVKKVAEVARVFDNYLAWKPEVKNKLWRDEIGVAQQTVIDDTPTSTFTASLKATQGLVEMNPDGSFKRTKTGELKPTGNVNTMANYKADPIRAKWLEHWAQKIADKKGGRAEDHMLEAFIKNVASAGDTEVKTTVNEKSGAVARGEAGQLAQLAKDRYATQIHPAIYGDDRTLQGQAVKGLFNPESGFDADITYTDPLAKTYNNEPNGEKLSKQILVRKFISSPTIVQNPLTDLPELKSAPGWVPFKLIDISTPEKQRAAVQEVNRLNPDSPRDAEVYRKIVQEEDNSYHKTKGAKISTGINWK